MRDFGLDVFFSVFPELQVDIDAFVQVCACKAPTHLSPECSFPEYSEAKHNTDFKRK